MSNIIYKDESYKIIGACLEVHAQLGPGLLEILYKDALEYEFHLRGIPYQREKRYEVIYKGYKLPHHYNADFVAYDEIILEVKAQKKIADGSIKQTLNYIALAESQLGIILNFGNMSFEQKRLVV
ncbi:MAG: GxxExxY protein [Saprospiraceae bacterium]